MIFEQIALERRGPVAWIALDRPDDLNCLSPAMITELNAALDGIQADEEIRCVVLTGRGRAFCAGADLKFVGDFAPAERDAATARFLRHATDLVSRIEAFPKTVIAAVNGIATAGGMEIILGCDIVIAAAGARLGDGHANYGLLPGAGASARLPRRLGLNHAKYLMFTGDLLSVSNPLFASLVSMIVPDAELAEAANELAMKIASRSALGLRHMKQLLNAALEASLENAIERELQVNSTYSSSYDRNEGLAAFQNRRTPEFKGI
ncbi:MULTISPECIES: enoyl-CoA hydratase/isomerase family protein [Sphingobium]|uniref:enoyl-CoA hydratase/isomerase family protein n=1 Tax=Sphingobium TaxID=165695 RepID=UPI00159C020B|nr:enoyl-CoA hydratase/isomerase family protein [Sphingobium sp. 15-1]